MDTLSAQPGPDSNSPATALSRWHALIRPKGHIDPLTLMVLTIIGGAPLILVFARILAFPGIAPPPILDIGWLRGLGSALNQSLSLEWVPPADRPTILYLLLLPTGALIVAMARLTFGLRVLGFRAILIAIGFQISGVLPSLILITIVVVTIVAIRPWMRRIRLPLYARVAIILCLASIIMVGALLIAPVVRSEVVWSVAFFPVIILAMLAEGVAKTLAQDNAVTAAWRAGWTLIVALIIAAICQMPIVRECALRFPELLLTQLVAIVLIAEFFDLRLLEQWPARLSKLFKGTPAWRNEKPIVAVVRNRWNTGIVGRLGRAPSAKYRKRSVQRIVDVLRDEGFMVRVFEGDIELLNELKSLLPPAPAAGAPGGLVLNLATGVQGDGRFCQVPAMLELAGVAYTGPDPVAQANLLDRFVLLTLLKDAGIAVPRFAVTSDPMANFAGLQYPLSVRPRRDPERRPKRVSFPDSLKVAVSNVLHSHGGQALIEEQVEGREIRASLIGNETIECFPLLEYSVLKRDRKACPAAIDAASADRVRDVARKAYVTSGCRDYARIDIRLPKSGGEPTVIAVNWDGLLARRGSFVRSAETAGYSFAQLVRRIVDVAWRRYGSVPSTTRNAPEPPALTSNKRITAQ